MSEKQFQNQIIQLARMLGYRVAHFRPALRQSGMWSTPVAADGSGFPDLVLVGRGRVLFVELKSEKGRLSPAQKTWRDTLIANGADYFCWRPTDYDEIVEILSEKKV